MSLFATEFSTTADLTQAAFTAEIIGWLRGVRDSRILAEATEQDLDADAPLLRAASGETLAMLRLAGEGDAFALGFRHDLPDSENRIWRTEGVLRRADEASGTILRIRGQCIAAASVAQLHARRRPHLIRALLERGIGGRDGVLQIQTTPHLLRDTEDDQLLASDITEGKATRHLPVVYVSAISTNRWIAGRDELSRLALDLAGVAHVVLEPRRELSFRVKELTNGRNVYGGTIGIAVPQLGIVRRLFIGWALPDAAALLEEIRAAALDLRTDMGRATQDTSKISKDLPDLLLRLGYEHKSAKTHIRMEADPALLGVGPVTIPKTPSDHRTGDKQRSQTEAALGLKRLDT